MRAARLALAARHLTSTSKASVASPAVIPVSPSARRYVSSGGSNANPRPIARLLEWKPQEEARNVVVNGFIRSVRSMKSRSFVALGDGSSIASLQALVPSSQAQGCAFFFHALLSRVDTLNADASLLHSLAIGAAVRLTGSWVASKGSGQSHELQVDNVQVLGPSDPKVHSRPADSSLQLLGLRQARDVLRLTIFALRHFRFRRSTRLLNTCVPYLIFGRELPSTPPS